ncbi:adenylosuccinate synthetase [Cordyceps militaris]|uniref:Adenylosuccinate synthetase n=1 Tax=Cordyceps militaris TaxID=73501 RepID=A0A2H4SW79_CORMI|nr:adenylosuccinate synthetase [Cordyceps militaris]
MSTTIIIGSQWGDEGKGKLTDIFCSQADVVARAAGGHNAGHVVQANGIYHNFRLLPSGLMVPKCQALIGTGVVFHLPTFFQELADIQEEGIKDAGERVFVSDRCHVNFDLHGAVDAAQEEELAGKAVGSMRRGIGPCYSTKAIRSGIRVAEIFNEARFEEKLRRLAAGYQKRFGGLLKYDVDDEIARFKEYRVAIQKYVVDGVLFMARAKERGANIVVEGSQAILLDVDYGTYPHVTSSSTGLGGAISGLGLGIRDIKEVIGVTKAYNTRLGLGGFPTEDAGEVGQQLQKLGGEYAAVIKQKLRCGWLDLVALRYSCMINNYDSIQLSKLDVLDTFERIKVGIAYRDRDTGAEMPSFPADHDVLERVEVVYEELPGWNTSIAKRREWAELPTEAQKYVEYIERFIGVKANQVDWNGCSARGHYYAGLIYIPGSRMKRVSWPCRSCEAILCRPLLVSAQRVSTTWRALMTTSPALQQELFFLRVPGDDANPSVAMAVADDGGGTAEDETWARRTQNPLLVWCFSPCFFETHDKAYFCQAKHRTRVP